MTQQTIMDAAYKAYKSSPSVLSFAAWLEAMKSRGFYWSA